MAKKLTDVIECWICKRPVFTLNGKDWYYADPGYKFEPHPDHNDAKWKKVAEDYKENFLKKKPIRNFLMGNSPSSRRE